MTDHKTPLKRPPVGQTFEFDPETGDRIRCWWNTVDGELIETRWIFSKTEWESWHEDPKHTVHQDREYIKRHALFVENPDILRYIRALEAKVGGIRQAHDETDDLWRAEIKMRQAAERKLADTDQHLSDTITRSHGWQDAYDRRDKWAKAWKKAAFKAYCVPWPDMLIRLVASRRANNRLKKELQAAERKAEKRQKAFDTLREQAEGLHGQLKQAEQRARDAVKRTKQLTEFSPLAIANAEIARLREENERLGDIQHQIDNWCKAYPLGVFPEPDFDKVKDLLGPGLLSAVSASNMRHIVNGIQKIIDTPPEEG